MNKVNFARVVNPGNPQRIEIRPQELLQVIFVDYEEMVWDMHTMSGIDIKCIRHEVFITDGFNRPQNDFMAQPCCRQLNVYQHHFWFRVNPKKYDLIYKLDKDQDIAVLGFKSGDQKVSSLTVSLLACDSDKEQFMNLMTDILSNDPIGTEAATCGLVDRYVNEKDRYILNPHDHEDIRFAPHQKHMLIEVAQPCYLRNQLFFSPSWINFKNITYTNLYSRVINGVPIQRFLVKNDYDNKTMTILKGRILLGSLRLSATDENNVCYTKFNKKLDFWLRYDQDYTNDTISIFEDDESDYIVGDDGEDDTVEPLRNWMAYAKPERLQRTLVKIEDIGNDILSGVKMNPMFVNKAHHVVDPENNTVICATQDEQLIVHLYRNHVYGCDSYWKMKKMPSSLNLKFVESDSNRQKFHFHCEGGSNTKFQTLEFECAYMVKRIYVQYQA